LLDVCIRYGIILCQAVCQISFFFGYELVTRLKAKSAIFGSWQKMYTSFLATIKICWEKDFKFDFPILFLEMNIFLQGGKVNFH
jgi:hypothetical protein